ncbi:MAG: T9SS type A sorting domain-containing protein, partial [Bacteroidota bacterium]
KFGDQRSQKRLLSLYLVQMDKIVFPIFLLFSFGLLSQDLNNPEELYYHPESKSYFISNTSDGQLFRANKNQPLSIFSSKGMGSHGIAAWSDRLLALKGDRINLLDIETGALLGEIQISGAKFLKDIVQLDGNCFLISDFSTKKIFKLKFNRNSSYEISEWLKLGLIPCGLMCDEDFLYVAHWGQEGAISRIDLSSKEVKNVFLTNKSNLMNIASDGEFLFVNAWKENEVIQLNKDFKSEPTYIQNPKVLYPGGLCFDRAADKLRMTDMGLNRFNQPFEKSTLLEDRSAELNAFPNPVTYNSRISYHLDEEGEVIIQLFNCKGQLLKTVKRKFEEAGDQQFILEKENLSDGLYFLQIRSDSFSEAIPLTFVH